MCIYNKYTFMYYCLYLFILLLSIVSVYKPCIDFYLEVIIR